MVNSCAACTKTIRSTNHIQCSKCSNYFHAMCVNLSDPRKLSEDFKAAWICPLCQTKEPRRDNSNTPVRAVPAPAPSAAIEATVRSGGRPAIDSPQDVCKQNNNSAPCSPFVTPGLESLSDIVSQLKLLCGEVGEMKTQMKSLTEHVTLRLDEYGCKLHALEEREIARDAEILSLKNTVAQLSDELNSRAQLGLKNEIEIAGITEASEENPIHLVRVMAQKIGVPLDDGDLDFAMRVGPIRHTDSEENQSRGSPKLPRPLIVRFVRRLKREEFMKAAKSRRHLSCTDIVVDGVGRKIYVNERLTLANRQLFRSTRQRCKETGFKFCWTKNGIIHVRRQEGNPAITIGSSADLQRHLGSLPSLPS